VRLTRLVLTDFRSYEAADLAPAPGVNVIVGGNGQGKTNLLEAAAYVAGLASHRVSADAALVRRGAARAVLRAAVASAGRESLVEIEINPGRANRARLNRAPVTRPRQVLGTLRTVLFAPEDLALVKGDPEQRRRFLDELLVATAPRYAAVRSDYERALRQRTALLKSLRGGGGRALGGWSRRAVPAAPGGAAPGGDARLVTLPGPRMLDVWDEQLAASGAELLAGRIRLTAAITPLVAAAYTAVSGGQGGAAIAYRQSSLAARAAAAGGGLPVAESADGTATGPGQLAAMLADALARARAEEIERGVCLVGPHRDDLDLGIGELPARGYASQGEAWSMALALRLAAYGLLRSGGEDPVLLLDDVFAELDAGRRERLATLVAGAEQVLITAAVPGDVPAALAGARFRVAEGTVSRAG
jgi:DNA replication and repair protein RecF